ncbi:hypothetical protein QBC42DRAFT_298899 [Cladorrhinum samala]|uniref:Uncharacterized protein n=1 Tax=Cladorrhinum samala TaxID=585594 RepID=A0AAV9HJR2_9PEZI|nr:hypothetical protein QBC42DRAFT_298899 [Cladorrhinum samala]
MHALTFLVAALIPGSSLAGSLANHRRETTGPCPITATTVEPCRDMLDSSACWNGIIGRNGDGSADRAAQLWNCVPGGKKNMCECYGCDWGLDRYVTRLNLCVEP